MYTHYVALGDSMSIDLYPSQDREPGVYHLPAGAASLLYRDDRHFRGFAGQDLSTLNPGIKFIDFTRDGDTIDDILRDMPEILAVLKPMPKPVITITAGGNDFLEGLALIEGGALTWPELVQGIQSRYNRMVTLLENELPNAHIVLTTVYDPTDESGLLPGYGDKPLPVDNVRYFNEYIATFATERIQIADVYTHFLGHGTSARSRERWYWPNSIIEPGARGASEIRRLWLEAIARFEAAPEEAEEFAEAA